MSHIHVPSEIEVRYLPRSSTANMIIGAMIGIGLAALVMLWLSDPHYARITYVVNWLYFTSISMGGLLLVVATWITKAK